MNPALHPLTFSAAACKVFSYKVFFSPLSKKQAAGPPWVSRLFCFYRRVSCYYSVGVGLPDDPNRTCTRSIPSVGADAYIGPLRRPLLPSVGRGALTPPPVILCISCNVSLRASDRRHWCGDPSPCITPPVAPFLSAAKEREKRTPPNPMVLESFSRLRC